MTIKKTIIKIKEFVLKL